MKKFVAIVLALVLVFSMGVPSFAVSQVELTPFQWSNLYSILQNIYDKNDTNVTINNLIYGIFNRLVTLDDNGNVDWGTYYDMGYMPLTQQFYGSWFWYVLQGMIDLRVDVLEELQNGTIPSKLTSMLEQNLSIMEYLSYVPDLFTNAWDSYSDSWFNQTYNQNNVLLGYVEYFPKLFTNEWDTFSDSWFNQTFTVSSLLYENSELFEDSFLENKYQSMRFNTSGGNYLSGSVNYPNAINNTLYSLAMAFTTMSNYTFDNPFVTNGETKINERMGRFANLVVLTNYQTGFLARLAYVLADDEEIRLNQTLQDSKTEVVDFVGNGITSSNGSSLSLMSGITDGIGFANDFNEFFSMPDVGLGDIFKLFDDTSESLSWFTEETASNIDTVPTTFSRESNPQTEVVTSYYEDRKSEFNDMWGDIVG